VRSPLKKAALKVRRKENSFPSPKRVKVRFSGIFYIKLFVVSECPDCRGKIKRRVFFTAKIKERLLAKS